MATIKNFEIDKSRTLRDLDLSLKSRHRPETLSVVFCQITTARGKQFCMFE